MLKHAIYLIAAVVVVAPLEAQAVARPPASADTMKLERIRGARLISAEAPCDGAEAGARARTRVKRQRRPAENQDGLVAGRSAQPSNARRTRLGRNAPRRGQGRRNEVLNCAFPVYRGLSVIRRPEGARAHRPASVSITAVFTQRRAMESHAAPVETARRRPCDSGPRRGRIDRDRCAETGLTESGCSTVIHWSFGQRTAGP
jgi:hypothetical protein